MRKKAEELSRRRAEAKKMGGEARLLRQKERGKLDARARMDLLLDPGTFREIGLLATHLGKLDSPTPADGVVCGTGFIEERPVCAAAYDFTVQGGSIGPVGERKVARLRELALRERIPMIWLIDSAGARLSADPEEAAWISSFADTGYLFREQVVMSGVVPQVAAMVGPGAAGTAYIPGLADFVPMVRGTSSIAIGGPYLVKSGGRRGGHRGGAGRIEGAHRGRAASPIWRSERRGVHRGGARVPLLFSFPRGEKPPRRPARTPRIGATRRCSTWCRRARARRTTCTR